MGFGVLGLMMHRKMCRNTSP